MNSKFYHRIDNSCLHIYKHKFHYKYESRKLSGLLLTKYNLVNKGGDEADNLLALLSWICAGCFFIVT